MLVAVAIKILASTKFTEARTWSNGRGLRLFSSAVFKVSVDVIQHRTRQDLIDDSIDTEAGADQNTGANSRAKLFFFAAFAGGQIDRSLDHTLSFRLNQSVQTMIKPEMMSQIVGVTTDSLRAPHVQRCRREGGIRSFR